MKTHFDKYPAHYTVFILFFVAFINGFFLDQLHQINLTVVWAYDIFQFVLLPFSLFYILFKVYDIRPHNYGISVPGTTEKRHSLIYISIFCAALLLLFHSATYELVKLYIPDRLYEGYLKMVPDGLLKIPVVIYMSLTAAVVEEITYRGIPLLLLDRYKKHRFFNSIYAYGTAIIFTSVHWENGTPDIAAAFVFGLLAAMLYLHYKNLIPLIFAHFVIDIVQFW